MAVVTVGGLMGADGLGDTLASTIAAYVKCGVNSLHYPVMTGLEKCDHGWVSSDDIILEVGLDANLVLQPCLACDSEWVDVR